MTRPDLDVIRARCEAAAPAPWVRDELEILSYGDAASNRRGMVIYDEGGHGEEEAEFIAHARTDIPALLAYIDELESCTAFTTSYTIGETEWAQRIAVAEQRFADEHDAHQETRTLLTDLYMKQLRADAAQMREYGISYEGVRKVLHEYNDGEISFGKLMDLIRAAARAMAEDDRRAASNLLAIIHGDGGHYEDAHGTVKACKDAEGVVSDLRLKLDAATHALGLLYEETTDPSRCTVELYAGDYRHHISEPCRVAVKNALQQRSLGEKLRHLLPQDWNKPDGVEGLE